MERREGELLRAALTERLRVHPRLVQQKLGTAEGAGATLFEALPPLVPFRGEPLDRIVAVLDWDHRLPSQRLMLRLYLSYAEAAAARFEAAYDERAAQIARRDLYPEFDLPDFEDLDADESYEAELTTKLEPGTMRLTSPWRRAIEPELAERAVHVVRASAAFATVRDAETRRPLHLGDLDPVSWMPPCESGHARWTIDVWWLTSFDGRVGTGWSFLVDAEAHGTVVTHREFAVRAA